MNILHMKYVVEVSKNGSINKASEKLLIAPPNLSRCVRDLEADLGIRIFERTNRGMRTTPEGEEFIRYAKRILSQIDEMEAMYKSPEMKKQHFSVSVPRTVKNILTDDYKLGIIRYASVYDREFKKMLDEKGLCYEMIAQFHYVLLMSRDNPLSSKDPVYFRDLEPFMEIAHGDPYAPALPLSAVKKQELPDNILRRVCVFERASQFDLLSQNPRTYMWVSPIPAVLKKGFRLVEKSCRDNKKMYKDVVIYKNDYKLSDLDKLFITEVCKSKRTCFNHHERTESKSTP